LAITRVSNNMKDHRSYLVTIGTFEILSGAFFIVHPELLSQNIDTYSSQVFGAALVSLGFALMYDAVLAGK
jgi:hypothetical protein